MKGEIVDYVPVQNFPNDEALKIIIEDLEAIENQATIISVPVPNSKEGKSMSISEIIEHLKNKTPEGLYYLQLARNVDQTLKENTSYLKKSRKSIKDWLARHIKQLTANNRKLIGPPERK